MKNIDKNQNIENKIIEIVKNNIISNNLINHNDKILVAVSGGPDSLALLDILYKLKAMFQEENIQYELLVAHVNHMIREESYDEKKDVEKFCKQRSIPFYYLEKDVPNLSKENKMSEETYGRKIRYEFFDKILTETNSNKIAVAHNLDDNIETILGNVIRGSGTKGLIGIKIKNDQYIRPIINIEKKDILKYCEFCKLNPAFDKTNEMDIYRRNKIRLKLIPFIQKELNPNIYEGILKLSKIVADDEDFMDNYCNILLKNIVLKSTNNKIEFNFEKITLEYEAIKTRLIRKIIEMKLGNLEGIEFVHVCDILKLLSNNIKGKKYIIASKFTVEIIAKNIAIIY